MQSNSSRYLSRCLTAYGILVVVAAAAAALVGILSMLIGKVLVVALLTFVKQQIVEAVFGPRSTAATVLAYLIQLGPYVIGLLSLVGSFVVGAAGSAPFFMAARAVRKDLGSMPVWCGISALLCVMAFPLGTALAVWAVGHAVVNRLDGRAAHA